MEDKKKKSNKWLLYLGIGIGVVVVLFLSIRVIPQALVLLTRASGSDKVSIVDSYLIGEKILAKADGKDECVVNVFLLDNNGRGVSGRNVELIGMSDGVKQINNLSNEMGKISFRIVSNKEGQFALRAVSSGVELSQEVTVTFRK